MGTFTDDGYLYARIADRFQLQIRNEVLKAGDRLPSIRNLGRELGVSISTVYKAYVELENMGLIEARPKSGYYVKYTKIRFSEPPEVRRPAKDFSPESVSHMVKIVFDRLSAEGLPRLAVAGPSSCTLPIAGLNKSMMEALRSGPHGNANYEDKEGNLLLRREIAKNVFKSGVVATANDVITTHGCNEAILFCLRALTVPGDVVAIESPAYFGIFNIMLSLDLKVMEIPVDPETGLDIEYLERAMEEVKISACLFIPNFNNPSGTCMPDSRKEQLVALLTRKKTPLIEDDACGEVFFGKSRPITCKSFDKEGWVLLCSSITKTIAPGYRVGWCLPGRFTESFIQMKMIHSVTSATPTQAAIGRFFESGRYDLHMRSLRKALYTQYLRYSQGVATYFPTDVKISNPAGGYSLWIELHTSVDAFELYKAALNHKISIAPGHIFSVDQRFTNFIRISFGMPYTETMERGLITLGRLIEGLWPYSSSSPSSPVKRP